MDKRHFPDFYRQNVTKVYRFVYFRVHGDKHLAEDLTQDVFMKALQAFETFDPEISQTSWIFTIARNHLINHMDKQRPTVSLEDVQEVLPDKLDAMERLALKHDEQRLIMALKALPAEDAELVRLKYLEGWAYEEIAEQTGKTAGSLRVQAHRALKALKSSLKHK